MKGCIVIASVLCLIGCSNESNDPVAARTLDSTVHLAGTAGGGGYWKNGVFSPLSNGASSVNSMAVDGPLVLIGGSITLGQAAIWKNGVEVPIDGGQGGVTLVASRGNNVFAVWATTGGWVLNKNNTTTSISPTGWPTAIALHGNDDVFIGGSSAGNEYPWGSDFYAMDTYAMCWKNEQMIFKETVKSYVNTILFYHDDLYLGGHRNHYPSLDKVACYWKNGQRVELTEEDQDAEVKSLFITETHVYAAGVINDRAVYWKDGVATTLSDETSIANSIFVLETDVYVAGREDKFPAVWKNEVKQLLPNQERQGEIKVVVAISN